MDWGLLSGLGQALQGFGNMRLEQNAEDRRRKLAEQLEIDRENRMLDRFDPKQMTVEQGSEGQWETVRRNGRGEVIGRDLAPKNVIDEIMASQKERAMKYELTQAQIDKMKREQERDDQEWNLLTLEDRRQAARYKNQLDVTPAQQLVANTSIQRALTSGSGRGGSGAGGSSLSEDSGIKPSPILSAKKQYKASIDAMQKEYEITDSEMDQAIALAQEHMVKSAKNREKPLSDYSDDQFIRFLRAAILTNKGSRTHPSAGGGIRKLL